MSLLKNWKLLFAAFGVVLFTACAGSSGGSGAGSSDPSGSGAAAEAPKKEISEQEVKKAEKEAMAITEENHKLRKEIFDAKNKLGMPTESASEEAPAEVAE